MSGRTWGKSKMRKEEKFKQHSNWYWYLGIIESDRTVVASHLSDYGVALHIQVVPVRAYSSGG